MAVVMPSISNKATSCQDKAAVKKNMPIANAARHVGFLGWYKKMRKGITTRLKMYTKA
jgi:hypothetical protein